MCPNLRFPAVVTASTHFVCCLQLFPGEAAVVKEHAHSQRYIRAYRASNAMNQHIPSRNSLHFAVLGGYARSVTSVMIRLPGLALETVCDIKACTGTPLWHFQDICWLCVIASELHRQTSLCCTSFAKLPVLCCVVLCCVCVVLCCGVLWCGVLCCAVLCGVVLCGVVLCDCPMLLYWPLLAFIAL